MIAVAVGMAVALTAGSINTMLPPVEIDKAIVGFNWSRYEVIDNGRIFNYARKVNLIKWLESRGLTEVLIGCVIRDLLKSGKCVLGTKGIVIRDTMWKNPKRFVMPQFIPTYKLSGSRFN
mgnify:CR=1 FL=1